MSNIPTPHISAKMGEIAPSVLMPGDPLRAQFIAENFLTDVKCFNKVRNMLGFTGKYKGKTVSVMGSGMGMASIGIYSYELFGFYGVENIIRIGSAGAISEKINLKDIVIAMGACTDSNYAMQYNLGGSFTPVANFDLLSKAVKSSNELKLGKNALCILTVSDCPLRGESLSSDERQKGFSNMVEIALNTALS